MSALHVLQGAHLRCLAGNPAPSDPPMDRVILAAQFVNAEFIICNAALSVEQVDQARTFAPRSEILASFNMVDWPENIGSGNTFYDLFRAATRTLVYPGSTLYKLEPTVAAEFIAYIESISTHFDGLYLDEFYATLPPWIVSRWEALGVSSTKTRKWPTYRDVLLESITRPSMANVGPVTSSGAQKYRSKGLVVSVEAQHGTPAEIVRALAPAAASVVWPSRTQPLPQVYTELPGMIVAGEFLPSA